MLRTSLFPFTPTPQFTFKTLIEQFPDRDVLSWLPQDQILRSSNSSVYGGRRMMQLRNIDENPMLESGGN